MRITVQSMFGSYEWGQQLLGTDHEPYQSKNGKDYILHHDWIDAKNLHRVGASKQTLNGWQVVAGLRWVWDEGITGVVVRPEQQREGLATALLLYARRLNPDMKRSTAPQTWATQQWAESNTRHGIWKT